MNEAAAFPSLFEFVDQRVVVEILLVAARFFGFTTSFPLFTWVNINGLIRVALAIGLAVGMPADPDSLRVVLEKSMWFGLVLMAKEIAVGAILGVLLGLPVWAAQVAGDLADTYRGANASNIFDPLHAEELTIGGQVNALIAMSCIVAISGVPLVIELVMLSFSMLPVHSLGFAGDQPFAPHFRMFMDRLVTYGLVIASPLLILMLIAELAFSLQTKLARQFGIDTLAPAVKSLAYLLVIPLYGVFLYQYSEAAFHQIFAELFRILFR